MSVESRITSRESRVVGKPTKRIEGLEKVTGAARYTEDLYLPGMLHARLVLSPHPHARVVAVPREIALAVPGVAAVVTEADLPDGVSSQLLADDEIERTYTTGRLHQAYMEPHATIAAPDSGAGTVTVYTSTQGQFYVRSETADALGIAQHQVRVVPMTVGGGFGGKIVLLEPLAAAMAVMQRRPVRLVLTRRDDFLFGTPAPECEIWLRTGARRDGTLTALQARLVFDSGA